MPKNKHEEDKEKNSPPFKRQKISHPETIPPARDYAVFCSQIRKHIIGNEYVIPKHPPDLKLQKGHTCGLYALNIALNLSHPRSVVPPARKSDDKKIPPRHYAKLLKN